MCEGGADLGRDALTRREVETTCALQLGLCARGPTLIAIEERKPCVDTGPHLEALTALAICIEHRGEPEHPRFFPPEAGARRFDGQLGSANIGAERQRIIDERRSDRACGQGARRQHGRRVGRLERETQSGA